MSALTPIGVDAALHHAANPEADPAPRPKIFEEFSLAGRVGIVTGGNSGECSQCVASATSTDASKGLGLEMALALCEAGAKAIYCIDIRDEPSVEWKATRDYVKALGNGSRLEYASADTTNQQDMWDKVEKFAEKEGRMDVCVAAAGILKAHKSCLDYPAEEFRQASGPPQ